MIMIMMMTMIVMVIVDGCCEHHHEHSNSFEWRECKTQVRDLESNQTLIAKPFPELVTSRLVLLTSVKILVMMMIDHYVKPTIFSFPYFKGPDFGKMLHIFFISATTEPGYSGWSFEVQEARKNLTWARTQR